MGWIYFILCIIGWHVGIYGMFKKIGIAGWKAFVPFYNTWCIAEVCGIKRIWFWLQFIPIVGQFISIWITIIFSMHFGKTGFLDHVALVFLPFIYMPYLGFSKNVRWGGKDALKNYKKSVAREWADAAVFAIVAATIIRTFIFEAYTIPSESMEKTLLVSDFLFVNKLSYGPRLPITPISFPFVHNTMPMSESTPSYLKWVQLPYKRLPGLTHISRNDVVVFNVPEGDTIINEPNYRSLQLYYDVLRHDYHGDREMLRADHPDILVHPMDKTDNYIKRCTGVPGDNIQVVNGMLSVNGQPAFIAPGSQMDYNVPMNGKFSSIDELNEKAGIEGTPASDGDLIQKHLVPEPGCIIVNMTPAERELAEKFTGSKITYALYKIDEEVFPFMLNSVGWTRDNYGPVHIPKKGEVIQLTDDNVTLYRRMITTYEGNTLEGGNGKYLVNGKEATTYVTKYDYYWMMGDNRHRSQDSRFWGFVPETNIVGRASMIWFSWGSNGPRWGRFFRSIK